MAKLCFIPLMAILLAVACISPALAENWTAPNGQECLWTKNGDNVWELNALYPWAKAWGIGESSQQQMGGTSPVGDPWIIQEVYNDTDTAWTDWHIILTNATIDQVAGNTAYCEEADDPLWTIEYLSPSEAFIHVVSGYGTQVDPEESLYVKFSYTCTNPGSNVYVNQYPTNDIPIPEPASIAGLLFGLATFGFGIRRRVK